MERHVLVTLLLLSLIVFDVSDASFVRDLRKLVAVDPKSTKDSPPPSEKKPDPKPVDEAKKNKEDPPSTNDNNNTSPAPQPQHSPKVENVNVNGNQKEINNTPPPVSPPPVPKKADVGGKGKEEKKEENGGRKFSQSATNDTCDGLNTCTDDGDMLACISKIDRQYLVVLVHNRGDGAIKAKLRSDFDSNLGDIEVDKNKTEKINITRSSSESTQLTLNAGKEDCVLHMVTHVPEGSFVVRLPSYDKILTPVNGAYFLIFTVLVFGGTWACCMLFRKKRHDEVPYQELEMALPESASATNVESAEGWDQGWDDDWDEDVAVKSPAAHHAGSISANGLTSRSSNKEGWENDWDD